LEELPPPPAASDAVWSRRGRLLATFFVGQGLTQFIGLVTGFLLLRWLSVEDYAKFTLAFGFQCTLGNLADLGISGSIIGLVGPRGHDRHVVGQYVAASRWLRNRLFLVLVPAGAVAFHYFAKMHHWTIFEQLSLYGFAALCLYFQAANAWYTAPLLIRKELKANYRAGLMSSTVRLAAAAVCHGFALLNSETIYAINMVGAALGARWTRKAALPFMEESAAVVPETIREMLRYITPLAPGIIFFAFQGQISILLISLFGSTKSLAQVGALGRLGQLFAAFSAMNPALISPYFARLHASIALRQYTLFLLAAAAGCGLLILCAFLWPQPMLWILGSKYGNMRNEASWMVVAGSLGLLDSTMHGIAMARKWIFWWNSLLYISSVLSVQAIAVCLSNMNTARAVVLLSVATCGAMMAVQLCIAFCGLRREAALRT
jgi:O-antigen/teichoic acid export membrane protein